MQQKYVQTVVNAGNQVNEAMNMYSGAQAVVALYIALGGSIE